MAKLTNQQIFDRIYQGFIINGAQQCKNTTGPCLYAPQNSNQIGCAVGCLLSLEDAERLDTLSFGALEFRVKQKSKVEEINELMDKVILKYFDESQFDFLIELQTWHDYINRFTKEVLLEIGKKYGLTPPPQENN